MSDPNLIEIPSAGDTVLYRVVGDCQAPRIRAGDVIAAELVAAPFGTVPDLEPGELVILSYPHRSGEAGPRGPYLVTAGPDEAYGCATLVARRARRVSPGQGEVTGKVHAGLDLWFQTDVARILAATHETMQSSLNAATPLDPELARSYRQGFGDALRAVAVAFGVAVPSESVPATPPQPWRVGTQALRSDGYDGRCR
jgi:hypothetical protein